MRILIAAIAAVFFATAAQAEEVTASGSFEGASGHVTTGSVQIVHTDSGYRAILSADFSLDGAPDPKVAFGKDGSVEGAIFAKLESLTGQQIYAVPAELNPADYNEFYIWCERFAVPLGVASLN